VTTRTRVQRHAGGQISRNPHEIRQRNLLPPFTQLTSVGWVCRSSEPHRRALNHAPTSSNSSKDTLFRSLTAATGSVSETASLPVPEGTDTACDAQHTTCSSRTERLAVPGGDRRRGGHCNRQPCRHGIAVPRRDTISHLTLSAIAGDACFAWIVCSIGSAIVRAGTKMLAGGTPLVHSQPHAALEHVNLGVPEREANARFAQRHLSCTRREREECRRARRRGHWREMGTISR